MSKRGGAGASPEGPDPFLLRFVHWDTSDFIMCSGDTTINKADTSVRPDELTVRRGSQTVLTIGCNAVYAKCFAKGQGQDSKPKLRDYSER